MQKILNWFLSKNRISRTDATVSFAMLLLRVWVGAMMAFSHGWGKFMGYAERSASFSDPLGVGSATSLALAIFAELFCSIALALGLFTRAVAIPIMFTMLTVITIVHANDPWGKKELPLMFLAPLIVIVIVGPGKYSLDASLFKKSR
jgi:putative oxidoreductase